jgi:hypothetical protein
MVTAIIGSAVFALAVFCIFYMFSPELRELLKSFSSLLKAKAERDEALKGKIEGERNVGTNQKSG